jgi:hypothetical protein
MKGINVSIGLGVIKERRLCEQIRGLIQACEFPHLKLFVHLAYATAGRSAALLGLTWDRCDFERDKIYLEDPTLTQPHKGRAIVPMTAALRSVLLEAKGGALWRGNSSSLQGSIFSGASSGSLATRDLRCTRREIVIPALVRACPGHPDSQGTTAPFEESPDKAGRIHLQSDATTIRSAGTCGSPRRIRPRCDLGCFDSHVGQVYRSANKSSLAQSMTVGASSSRRTSSACPDMRRRWPLPGIMCKAWFGSFEAIYLAAAGKTM